MIRFFLIIIFALVLNCNSAQAFFEKYNPIVDKTWVYAVGLGYNIPAKGYEDYRNNVILSSKLELKTDTYAENFIGRLFVDYYLMNVPEYTNGLQEDMVNVGVSVLYGFLGESKELKLSKTDPKKIWDIYPYIGCGAYYALDWIKLDTKAVRETKRYQYLGLNASLGSRIRVSRKTDYIITPEFAVNIILRDLLTNVSFSISFGM